MLSKWQFHVLNALGLVAIALVMANGILFRQNRSDQIELNQRQQFIQQTIPLEGLYREIIKALADLAIKSNDRTVLNMLSAQGLSVTVNSPSLPASSVPRAAQVNDAKQGSAK